MKLTKSAVARLSLPHGKGDAILFDDDLPGFGIRLRAGGKRTWIVQYRVGRLQRRFTLGTPETLDADKAREQAKRKLAAVTLGDDPQASKQAARAKAGNTLGAVVETHLDVKGGTLRPRSFAETARYLRKYWKPLHGLSVHTLHRADIAARLAKIAVDNGPVAATRARAALSALLAWAMREGIGDASPVIGTTTPPTCPPGCG